MNDINTLYFNLLCVCTPCFQGTLNLLELELLEAVNSLMQMLETEPGSSTRAASVSSPLGYLPGGGMDTSLSTCPRLSPTPLGPEPGVLHDLLEARRVLPWDLPGTVITILCACT